MDPWPGGTDVLPPILQLLALVLLVDLVERVLELVGKAFCGWKEIPSSRSRDLWVLAVLLALLLSVPGLGLGSIFALGLILIALDLISPPDRVEEGLEAPRRRCRPPSESSTPT